MSNGLALRPQTEIQPRDNWDVMQEMAKRVSASGLFKGMTEPAILTLMLLAESEGLHPMKALMRYHIVEGRPTMRADTIQAEFQQAGGKLRWIKSTADECTAEFSHATYGKHPFTIHLTLQEFIDSGVALFWDKNGKQQMQPGWRRFPAAMLRARALTAGIRAVLPGVIMGIYSPEELDDSYVPPQPEPEPDDAPELPELPASAIRNVLEDPPQSEPEPARAPRTPDKMAYGPAVPPYGLPPDKAHLASEFRPVRETVEELREHQQTAPKARTEPAERAPTTEYGQWISDALEDFHRELTMVADLHPENLQLRTTVKPQQVMHALITAAMEAGFIDESAVTNAKGTRDNRKIGATLNELWKDDSDWIALQAGQYLARKMIELIPKQDAPVEP